MHGSMQVRCREQRYSRVPTGGCTSHGTSQRWAMRAGSLTFLLSLSGDGTEVDHLDRLAKEWAQCVLPRITSSITIGTGT